jgi:hypothetical protein
MDFIEAIKTRKKMRRPQWKPGYFIQACDNGLIHDSEFYGAGPYKVRGEYRSNWQDMLANDWELIEDPVELVEYKESNVTVNGEKLFYKVVKTL